MVTKMTKIMKMTMTTMNNKEIVNLELLYQKLEVMLKATQAGESFGIVTHNNPDGDGLAVSLGLKRLFSAQGITLDIVLQGGSLERLAYLDVQNQTIKLTPDLKYENIIVIDCHDYSRIGKAEALVRKADRVLIIDHHIKEEVIENADYYIDTDASCVGVIAYNLLKKDLPKVNKATQKYFAEAIYTSIINDTNNFLNDNVRADDFNISAELLKYGLIPSVIAVKLLHEKEVSEFKMIAETLSTLKLYEDGKILIFHTTKESLDRHNLNDEATAKMTQWVKGAIGVDIILYYREASKNEYKFSIRTDIPNYNVQQVAKAFGGGGHEKASGFTVKGNITEIVSKVIEEIKSKIYG